MLRFSCLQANQEQSGLSDLCHLAADGAVMHGHVKLQIALLWHRQSGLPHKSLHSSGEFREACTPRM
jgi:hypothetical protein